MSSIQPKAGQRWVSDTEPELGLGVVVRSEFGRVDMAFPASAEQRQYALGSAPLRRVQFTPGDCLALKDGSDLKVDAVSEREGLLFYQCGTREIPELDLSDQINFSKPEERLFAGKTDDLHTFDLRTQALRRRCEMQQSPVRGFVGGRVDLLSHQMYIAGEVASRLSPRVLLADEVGLGKTIEAGLILHRLHLTGRASRVLILVPEPLIHQWFIELFRRFNMLFSLFDEDRCQSIEQHDPGTNPFLDSQLVLCSVNFLSEHSHRSAQALEAGWDLLIADEAHHLEWHPDSPSPQYALVDALARKTEALLLLTATPQQLGPEGHFARLRLLDPDRYTDLSHFLDESSHYEQVAQAIDRVIGGKPLSKKDHALFAQKSPRIRQHSDDLAAGDATARPLLIAALLDEFGTGRVMFRNTRAALTGFPKRRAHLAILEAGMAPRIQWLASLLRKLHSEKILLICRTRELVEDIQTRLQHEINVSCAVFHEALTLLQRDRNAAWFAEPDGARILICSEIGSEGRNFQFAHHLVLFDLPKDLELLEQRIGRLDRIGQTTTIYIHIPYSPGTESETLARWIHEGLDAFEKNLHGANEIATALQSETRALLENFAPTALDNLIKKSRELRAKVARKLERGHDRLLELNSCKPALAENTIRAIRALDTDCSFEEFLIHLLDHFGLHIEELSNRAYLLKPGHLTTDAFPAIPEDGIHITFDRARALSREDISFMSWDHPILRSALDLLLGSEAGNSSFAVWKTPGPEAIFLELYAIIECVAPASLHAGRFLPATPVRVVVDHTLADHSRNPALIAASLQKGDLHRLLDKPAMKQKLLPLMLEKARTLAAQHIGKITTTALTAITTQLDEEIARLAALRAINDHIRPGEIEAAKRQKNLLITAISSATIRTDALRLILKIPA